jgi:chitodextrinase
LSIALALGPDGEPRIAYSAGPYGASTLLFAYRDPIPPHAVIEAPASAKVGAAVTLRATASTDNDEIAEYRWSFSDGTTGNGSVITREFIRGGTVAVRLDVTDAAKNVDTAMASIAVSDELPVARIAGPLAVDEDALANFSAVESTDDGGIVAYGWTVSGPWTASGSGPLFGVVFPEPGEYTVHLTVTDTGGNTNETILRVTVRDLLDPWVVPSIIWTAILGPEVVTVALLARHWRRRKKELWGEGGEA